MTYNPLFLSEIAEGKKIASKHLVDNFNAIAAEVNAEVVTPQLQDESITAAKIATDAVTTVKILDNAVTTAKVADANITNAKLALDSRTYISKHSVTAGTEILMLNLDPATYHSVEIAFSLAKSANGGSLQLQVSLDNGVTWINSLYAVGQEVKIVGGATIGAQNGFNQGSVDVGLFGAGADQSAVGTVKLSLHNTGGATQGLVDSICHRSGIDILIIRGGFRRAVASNVNAVKFFVTSGTITGWATVMGVPK